MGLTWTVPTSIEKMIDLEKGFVGGLIVKQMWSIKNNFEVKALDRFGTESLSSQ